MKFIYNIYQVIRGWGILTLVLALSMNFCYAQIPAPTIIPAGSFIMNMGIVPQTVSNGLKPYGLVYQLLMVKCPVHWVINSLKVRDGADFNYHGIDYKGGTFIVEAQYRTPAVNLLISTWTNPSGIYKVVGITTISPVTVPVFLTFWNAPNWTMDKQNGSIAENFFKYAGIPASAYGGSSDYWKNPADLTCCDDIFVMPHADPKWETHQRLLTWNSACKGAIWLGCHAGSALSDMFNPNDPGQQTNFLSVTNGVVPFGTGPYFENSLVLWGNHDDGSAPFSYNYPTDPIMQFMGSMDAAVRNGSEQIYLPVINGGWRPTTKICIYDPTQSDIPLKSAGPAAVLAYGPGMGDADNGKVMLQNAHNVSGTGSANVAAQRAFFNFSFFTAAERALLPSLADLPGTINSGSAYTLTYTLPAWASPEDYSVQWSSSCGGTFTPAAADKQTVTYTPAAVAGPTICNISVTIHDLCGRVTFDTHAVNVECNLRVETSITRPCYNIPDGGAIDMTIINGTGPFIWTWTKNGGGSGSGEGTTISGLFAGQYTITLTGNDPLLPGNGDGCQYTFTVNVSQLPEIIISAIPAVISCTGGSDGAINVSVSGGVPGYSYDWGGGITTQNRSGLAAGTYTLAVTDSKGCTASESVAISPVLPIEITAIYADLNCFGLKNGSINLAVSGGTPGVTPDEYTFLWNDGSATQNRTELGAGTYSVTVTDGNNCTKTSSDFLIGQPSAALSLSETHLNVLCNSNLTGTIDLTVAGGTAPYSFNWAKTGGGFSAATEDIGSLGAGNYTVTVTDQKGCSETLSVEITQPESLRISTIDTHPGCPPVPPVNPPAPSLNSNGFIDLIVTGGTPGYSYSWTASNGAIIPVGQAGGEDISGLVAGTYSVIVKDINMCSSATSVNLNYLNDNPVQPLMINH